MHDHLLTEDLAARAQIGKNDICQMIIDNL